MVGVPAVIGSAVSHAAGTGFRRLAICIEDVGREI